MTPPKNPPSGLTSPKEPKRAKRQTPIKVAGPSQSAIDRLIATDERLILRFDVFIKWLRRIFVATLVTALVVIVLMGVNVYFVVDNNHVGKNAQKGVSLIEGALNPKGPQAEQGKRATSAAQIDIDCRNRRALAHLPAPPDELVPCVDQTPSSVYPG